MDIILEQYRNRLTRLKRQRSTLVNFDKAARKFQAWLEATGRDAREIRAWDIEEFLDSLDQAETTKRTHLIHIGGAYRYAHRRGLIPADPTVDVLLPKLPEKEPRIIPSDELRAMRARIFGDRQWLIWHLLVYTGMRQGEIRALTWADVDFPSSTLHVLGKGGKWRYVPIHPALGESLVEQRGEPDCHVVTTTCGRPVAYDTWMADLRTFTTDYTAHDFRRTVATSLARNGVEERIADKILGWAPPTVGRRYYVNVATEELQRAILKLYANDPV